MRVFTAVAQTGSFSAAARELNMSKAMATKHVKHLETLLGARLLNRTTRRLRLTEIGAAYRDRCKQILTEVEETELAITHLSAQPRGTLKIIAPPSFGAFHLTPAVADYIKAYPEVKVHLLLSDRPINPVEEGVDLAIRVGRLRDSSLVARKLASVRVVVCGAPSYFERHGIPQVPSDLLNHNCLLYTHRVPKDIWIFRGPEGEISIPVSGNFEANVGDAVRMAAINGCGLAQLATYIVGLDIKSGSLQAALRDYEPTENPIYVIYPHRRYLSAAVRTFIDFLYARFHPKPYWDEW